MRQKKGFSGIIVIIILLLVAGGVFFIYKSKYFERNAPKIISQNEIYWNLKKPLDVQLQDDSGIKFAQAILNDGKNNTVLANKIYSNPKKDIQLMIKPPKDSFMYKKNHFTLTIQAVDSSKWNWFQGNKAIKKINIIIDTKRPKLYVIRSSYGIRKGGSALVIFKASDKNLKSLYIKTPFGKKFYPTPFYKKGYYISLLAWPVEQKNFSANIVAIDKANNISTAHVPLYFKSMKYRKTNITLTENFLNNKVANFINDVAPKMSNKTPVEKFVYINETIRKINEDLIKKVTTPTDTDMISNFYLKRFYPLIDAAAVAGFGDHRTYYYKGQIVSHSYHLGIDLASIARAKIRASNKGVVVFAKFNGIYGNNMIIYHGLGLYTLFGHCSEFIAQKGDSVKRSQVIARTGKTGMALGDHLHFGVYVQGVAVYPKEWMDSHWIKLNIFDIIKDAKNIINKN